MVKTFSEKLLGRASVVSYLMGIEIIFYLAVVVFLIFPSWLGSSLPFTDMPIGLGPPPAIPVAFSVEALATIMVISLTGFPLCLLFCYFNMELGKYYGVPALRGSGKAGIVLSMLSLILLPIEFIQDSSPSIFTSLNAYVYNSMYLVVFMLFLTLSIAALVVALEYIIATYRGFGGMKKKAGIDEFGTAKTFWLVGLFTYVTMPVAMVLYGNALRKLQKKDRITVSERKRRPTLGPQISYCSRCGSRIERGEHFCAKCGSPTYDEAE